MTADDWAIRAHETVHASEVVAQNYSTFDDKGNAIGSPVQVTARKTQADVQASLDYDLKTAYSKFFDTGIHAYIYFGKVVAGFTIKELVTFGEADKNPDSPDTEWKVRECIELGRTEWRMALFRIGIKAD